MKIGCPDPECHRNLNCLREEMKTLQTGISNLRPCISKRVKRWELWLIAAAFLSIAAPITYGIAKDSIKDRKSTRLNSSHIQKSRMPSSA